MIAQETDDESEGPVRVAVIAFLATRLPEFEALKAWLTEVKSRYPADGTKMP